MAHHLVALIIISAIALQPSLLVGSSAAPQNIKVQGFLKERVGGTPVPANGYFSMKFDLYDAPSRGNLIASAGPMMVEVLEGHYKVVLPFGVEDFRESNRYLEITIEDEVLSPRSSLLSTPFCYVAETLDGFEAADLEESAEIENSISAHASNPDAHLDHASLEESAEIVAAIEAHESAADPHRSYLPSYGGTMAGTLTVSPSSGHALLTTSGKVGIGTVEPRSDLDVVGNAQVSGALALGNNLVLGPGIGIEKPISNPYNNKLTLMHSSGIFAGDCNRDGTNDEDHVIGFGFNIDSGGSIIDPAVHSAEINLETTYCEWTSDRDGDGTPGNSVQDYMVEWNMDLTCPLDMDGDGESGIFETFRPWFIGAYPCAGTQGDAFAWFMSDRETTAFFARHGRMSIGHPHQPMAPLDIRAKPTDSVGVMIHGSEVGLNAGITWEFAERGDNRATDLYAEVETAGRSTYKLPAWGGGVHNIVASEEGAKVRVWCGSLTVDPGTGSLGDQFVATQSRPTWPSRSACSFSLLGGDDFGPDAGWILTQCRADGTDLRCIVVCMKGACLDAQPRTVEVCCHSR